MSDFWDSLPEQPSEHREELILRAIEEGRYDPITWVPVGVGLEEGTKLLLSVAADALKIDDERVTVNMTTMQKIVDVLGYAFPTSKISDLIYQHAGVVVGACTQTPDSKMAYTSRALQHSAAVDAKIKGRSGLRSTVGKDWVLSNRLVGHPDKSANYGWHDPGAQYTSPGGIKLWQTLGTTHDRWHVDYCLAPNTKVLTADLGWVPVSRLTVGTELIGFDEKLGGHRMRGSYVTSTNHLVLDCYEVVTDRGTIVASEEHRFVVANKRSGVKWVKTKKLRTDQTISFLCDPWDRAPDSWESGWLAGILDGEGWVSSNHMVGFAQKPGPVLDLACSILERDGFKLYKRDNGKGCIVVVILGERAGMRALGRYRPLRLLEKSRSLWEGRRPTGGQGTRAARILEVNYIGKHPVVALGTTTKTLIAEGFLSHNSQVVRLISRNCLVDGEQMDLMQLLTTDELAHLLSYEGKLQLVRMPGVPLYVPATQTPPVAGDTLGERCVEWCLKHVGEKEQPLGSNDSPFIRQCLAPCARGYGSKRVVLSLTKMNWCFTGDTEILTERGWLRFDLLEDSDKVAQVDPKTLAVSLVQPEARIQKKHEGPLVVVDRRSVHLVSDPEHRYFGRWMISSRELGASRELRPISDLLGSGSQVSIPTPTGTEGRGVNWEDRDLKLLAAFLADGSLVKGRMQFQVSRPDKIAMLEALVPDRSWIAPRAYGPRSKKSLTSFFFTPPHGFPMCWLSYKVLSPEFLWSLDRRQAALLLDTFAEYDGSARGGSVVISQSSKERTDMLQVLAVLAGYSCQTRKPRTAGEFGSTVYTLAYSRSLRNTVVSKNDVRETESISADLYCVRVPKGLIIVRSPGYGRALVVGNCAAFQCAAMQACLRPGEAKPHDYRAGVVELVEDTYPGQDGLMPFAGRYIPIEQTRKGNFRPSVGDLAIYDRSTSGKPETSWYRHVNRVISFHESEGIFQTVGGNEGSGEVKVGESHISQARLLGWIHYPQPEQPHPSELFTEHERQQIQNMVGMFLREAADRIWGTRKGD